MATYRNTISATWGTWSENWAIGFIDEVLRGLGQVMFQNNPLTGLLFLIGLFLGGWQFGLYALVGTAVSTLAAHILGTSLDLLHAGLYGFNGALVGVGLAFYLVDNRYLALYVVAASIIVAVIMAAVSTIVGTWQVPALTSPFVLTTAMYLLAVYGFSILTPSAHSLSPALPNLTAGREALTWTTIWHGLLNGPAEVFFQEGIWIGIIFLVGIAINSRISCLMAMLGSAVGVIVAWFMGVPTASIAAGVQGFNPVLTMIALGGVFYLIDSVGFLYALVAAAASVVVTAGIATLVEPVGSHTFTAPFVLTTWAFLFARPVFTRLRAVPPAQATTPEGNLRAAQVRAGSARVGMGKESGLS